MTDEIDRRVLARYLNQYFCEAALATEGTRSRTFQYFIPRKARYRRTASTSRRYRVDRPGVRAAPERGHLVHDHGLDDHAGELPEPARRLARARAATAARRRSWTASSTTCCRRCRSRAPARSSRDKAHDPSPLHVTLFQEVERYNILIETVLRTLKLLKKGVKGLVVMSADLDAIFDALASNKVPALYLKSYPSLKPLGAGRGPRPTRLEQIGDWIENTYPKCYWLGGSVPELLPHRRPRRRRRKTPSHRHALLRHQVMTGEGAERTAEGGGHVKNMFLEGAGWDRGDLCLCEPTPWSSSWRCPWVLSPDGFEEEGQGVYQCPLPVCHVRTGSREKPVVLICGRSQGRRRGLGLLDQTRHALLLALAT